MADDVNPSSSPPPPIQGESQGYLFLPYHGKEPSIQDPILEILNENGITTVTVQDQHGLSVGDLATIGGTVNTYLSGAFVITAVPTPFMLQYPQDPPLSPWPPPSNRIGPAQRDSAFIPPTPPIPGPPVFTGQYGYFTLPYIAVLPADSQVFFAFNPRTSIETMIMQKQLYAEKVSLLNNVTAYRIPVQYLWLLPSNREGLYIGTPPHIHRITPIDPTLTIQPTGPWVPVY